MIITILGQGYEPLSTNSVGNKLIEFLSMSEFHTFTGISAFASSAGIVGLSKYFDIAKRNFKRLNLIVGIDQEGTSKEALLEINALNINSYIFYQAEQAIFHPKIYLFEGENVTKLILGSSNLTARGLFVNVESSLLIEFSNHEQEGIELIWGLKDYYHGLFDFTDKNLFPVNSKVIEEFNLKGIVPFESDRIKKYKKGTSEHKELPKSDLQVPNRKIASIPREFRENRIIKKSESRNQDATIDAGSLLLWQSGPLTERDLNIPKGSNTNPTGSMLFKKGMSKDIDQRHYFRDTVFSSLEWVQDINPPTSHFERAVAIFEIIVEKENFGVFSLVISHNTKTDTSSYLQKNSMTHLSWGEAKSIIAKDNLIGKIAYLYKKGSNNEEFILEIR